MSLFPAHPEVINLCGDLPTERLIYGLRDPRTFEIRYVGKSSRGLARPLQHLKAKTRTYRTSWLKNLAKAKLTYQIVILEYVENETDLNTAERKWIVIGRQALGDRLTNQTEGGDGTPGLKWSEESRKKLSQVAKQRAETPEGRERLKQAQLKASTPEARRKSSDAAKRNALEPWRRQQFMVGLRKGHESAKTVEERSKRALRARQRFATEEGRRQILAALTTAHTEEGRKKSARANRERAKTQQGRAQCLSSIAKAQDVRRQQLRAMSPEERRQMGQRALASLPADQRRQIALTREARKPPEQRSEQARKGWNTRRGIQ